MAASTCTGPKQETATAIADDDDLFELDIDLLLGHRDVDGVNDDSHHHHLHGRRHCSDGAVNDGDEDDGRGHALLANCLLPVSSVSNAVPVAAAGGGIVSTSFYPYSGYYSSRRLFTGGGGGSKRFLFGRSARFCFSSRGFETMGNYFQRY